MTIFVNLTMSQTRLTLEEIADLIDNCSVKKGSKYRYKKTNALYYVTNVGYPAGRMAGMGLIISYMNCEQLDPAITFHKQLDEFQIDFKPEDT